MGYFQLNVEKCKIFFLDTKHYFWGLHSPWELKSRSILSILRSQLHIKDCLCDSNRVPLAFLRVILLHDDLKTYKKMSEKKGVNFESPNTNKMQAVVIDSKTTIYIALAADPEEAKERYLSRINRKEIVLS
jgi:hypothetical protein